LRTRRGGVVGYRRKKGGGGRPPGNIKGGGPQRRNGRGWVTLCNVGAPPSDPESRVGEKGREDSGGKREQERKKETFPKPKLNAMGDVNLPGKKSWGGLEGS